MLTEHGTIRFASVEELEFLTQQVYISAEAVERKVEWNEFLVAETHGEIVGFLQLEYLWSAIPYIALIRVVSDHKRKGIGKGMLHFLEDQLRKSGHKMLYSSSQANEPEPQEWHRLVGFEECGIITKINDGIDEIFFRKPL